MRSARGVVIGLCAVMAGCSETSAPATATYDASVTSRDGAADGDVASTVDVALSCAASHRVCGEALGVSCGACPTGDLCLADGTACLHTVAGFRSVARSVFAGSTCVANVSATSGAVGAGRIVRIDLVGDVVTPVAPSVELGLQGLAVAGDTVYWADFQGVSAAPIGGGDARVIYRVPSTQVRVQSMTARGDAVLASLTGTDPTRSGIFRFGTAGAEGVRIDDVANVQWMVPVGDDLLWQDVNGATLARTPIGGGARTTLQRVQIVREAPVGGGYVFYLDTVRRSVTVRIALADGATTDLTALSRGGRGCLPVGVIDNRLQCFYPRDAGDAADFPLLVSSALDGTDARVILTHADRVEVIEQVGADAANLYLVADNALLRMPRR